MQARARESFRVDIDAVSLWLATKSDSALKQARELGMTERLLNGQAKVAWKFITEYREKYNGEMPSVGIIVENSGCIIKPPPEEERISLEYVVDKLYERHEFKSLQFGLGKAFEALENGEQTSSREEVLRLADHLREDKKAQLQIHTLGQVAPEVLAMYERVKRGEIGVPFPWQTMTDMTLGLWPGTLTFFVARPGVGKTWTAVILALHAWKEAKKKVLIVSPELGRIELGERLVAKYGEFAYKDIVSATLGSLAEGKLKEVVELLHAGGGDGLFILDDEDKLSSDYIEQAIDAVEPELILIDSLYMLRVEKGKIKSGAGSKGDRMERVVETINWMRGLSRRKRSFAPGGLPVVGIHQLSREGKPRREAVQALKAGRGTGGLEDAVALSDALYWNAHNLFAMFQDPYMRQDKQLMYVPLKARRQAKISSLVIKWDMETMDFSEIGTKVSDGDGYKDDKEEVPY
jgi:replicative DNA helicase